MNNNTLNEIYTLLRDIGAVNNESEFCIEWLNRCEGYMRMLRFKGVTASDGCMAILSSKLQHYGYRMKETKQHKRLGDRFIQLSNDCHKSINENALNKWMAA
jgi:hypothetical protein